MRMRFADGVLSGKQLLLYVVSRLPPPGCGSIVLLLAEKTPFANFHVPDALVARVRAANGIVTAAGSIDNRALLVHFRGNCASGSGTSARMHSRSSIVSLTSVPALVPPACREVRPGKDGNQISAEGAECNHQSALKARSISEQQHDRGDAPCHAQHGEQATAAVVLATRCTPGFQCR